MTGMDDAGTTRPVTLAGRRALQFEMERFAVTVEEGPDRGREAMLVAASLCVGTDPSNDLVLSDRAASRRHAVLAFTSEGILVEDRNSTNGTWFNGARIRSAIVPDGGLLRVGESTLKIRLLPRKVVVFPDGEPPHPGLVGRSQGMIDVFAVIRQIARTDLPVLITGETGCGKELVARAVHEVSPRSSKPFLVLDCGSIVPDLLKSEIFGHERGAFTGAEKTRAGILESAAGGTVFLDEIGELSPDVQPNLLRALETREIRRVGSQTPIPVDFRIVAATNRDLAAMARANTYRADLYYRLACINVRLPPLRERTEDIELLARHFIEGCASRNNIPVPPLTVDGLDLLISHRWPGNVRELRNVVEAACAMCAGGVIDRALVTRILASGAGGALSAAAPAAPAPQAAAPPPASGQTDEETIRQALAATGWRRKAAARRLGISPTTLFAKIRRYGLKPPPGIDD